MFNLLEVLWYYSFTVQILMRRISKKFLMTVMMKYSTNQVPAESIREDGRQQQGQGHQNPAQVQGHQNQVAREGSCILIRMRMIFPGKEKDKKKSHVF